MDLYDYVQQQLEARGKTSTWLAGRLGIGKGNVTNWATRGVPAKWHVAIAQAFGMSVDELLSAASSRREPHSPRARVPVTETGFMYADPPKTPGRVQVVGLLQASPDGGAQLMPGGGHVDTYSADSGAYALRIVGDDMHPVFRHGEVLIIEPNSACVVTEHVFMRLADGRAVIGELTADRADAVTISGVVNGNRTTYDRSQVTYMHAVVSKVSASKYRP